MCDFCLHVTALFPLQPIASDTQEEQFSSGTQKGRPTYLGKSPFSTSNFSQEKEGEIKLCVVDGCQKRKQFSIENWTRSASVILDVFGICFSFVYPRWLETRPERRPLVSSSDLFRVFKNGQEIDSYSGFVWLSRSPAAWQTGRFCVSWESNICEPPAPSLEQQRRGMAFPLQTWSPGTSCTRSKRNHGGDEGEHHLSYLAIWLGVEMTGHANKCCQPIKGKGPGLILVSGCPPLLLTSRGFATAQKPSLQTPVLQSPMTEGRWLSCFPLVCRPFQTGCLAFPLPF